MYIDLKDAPCLVVGGGKVALRKVEVLLDFGANVSVVAPEITGELQQKPGVHCRIRPFEEKDIDGMALVVAAAGEAGLNHRISLLCKAQKIPVNAVDQKEDCTFLFPAYVKRKEVTAAVTSGGASPVLSQYLKRKIEEQMPENIGNVAEALGKVRPQVKAALSAEQQRKMAYQKLLELGLSGQEQADFPPEAVERIIKEVRRTL